MIDEHGAQPPARAIHILRQVCGALAEAHDLGLVHGDIKPANIMLCRCYGGVPDVAKVLDYGLSQAATKVGVADDLRALGRVGVALLGDEGPPDLAALLQRCSGDQGAALSNARALERALASCADAEGWSRAHAENWWQSVRDQQPDQASSPPSTRRPDELSVDPAHRSTP